MEGRERSQWRRGGSNGAVEACRTVVAGWHHFDEQQDPDPNTHQSGKRVRVIAPKVMRINMLSERKSKGHKLLQEDWTF